MFGDGLSAHHNHRRCQQTAAHTHTSHSTMNALWLDDDVNDADDDAKSFIIFVRWSFASYNAMNRALAHQLSCCPCKRAREM